MNVRSAAATAAILLAGGLVFAPPLRADHVAGATYVGTHSGGGSITLVVSADGAELVWFVAESVRCAERDIFGVDERFPKGAVPIADDAFAFEAASVSIRGSFTGTTAAGALDYHFVSPSGRGSCTSGPLTWAAATDVTAPQLPILGDTLVLTSDRQTAILEVALSSPGDRTVVGRTVPARVVVRAQDRFGNEATTRRAFTLKAGLPDFVVWDFTLDVLVPGGTRVVVDPGRRSRRATRRTTAANRLPRKPWPATSRSGAGTDSVAVTMDPTLLARFADLIVSVGANVQPDQVLAVEALPEAQPLVAEIAKAAYAKGARYVDVLYTDPVVKRIRAERAPEATLEWVPPWLGRRMLDLGDLDAARVVLVPLVPPGSLDGVDPARAGRDRLPTVQEIFQVIDERSIAWTLSPFPTSGWAQVVYPKLDPAEALARLWGDVAHVCRLDEPDPAAAWNDRIDQIWQVAKRLDALGLDTLRFEGPGTDLTVGLLPSSRFAKEGGASHTRTGVRHVPNIPTEEVYTTPDPERTEGVVTATKPLDVAGTLVTGLRIRFEGGRAVEIDAETNADALRARCATDDGASRLGEVALVDRESRIGRLGRTFFTTLLDENAASHVALGDAYSSPVADPADVARINASAVHIDFMIGSDDVNVTGTTAGGEQVPILRGGAWQI